MELYELLAYVTDRLESLGIEYLITGSVASVSFGEPRFTNDVDIVVRLSEGQAIRLCESLPEEEFYVSREAAVDAVRRGGQFNAIHFTSGLKVDFMAAGDNPYDESRFERPVSVQVTPDRRASFASPEDIILSKLRFYKEGRSDKHISDIRGILRVSGPELDRDYLERWAAQLGVQDEWRLALGES